MVSGFEKRRLSGMLGLLSVDCAKAGEIVPAMESVTAPATMRLRETSVENSCGSSEEDVSAMSGSYDRRWQYTGRVVERYLGSAPNNDEPQANSRSACTMAIGGMRGAEEEPGTLPQFKSPECRKSRRFLGFGDFRGPTPKL